MDIQFDFNIVRDNHNISQEFNPLKDLIETEIEKFVEGRLSVYTDKIDDYPAGIIAVMFSTKQIRFYNFPGELSVKLSECFSEDDFTYIFTRIYYLLNQQ